jgi:hypothetical protein
MNKAVQQDRCAGHSIIPAMTLPTPCQRTDRQHPTDPAACNTYQGTATLEPYQQRQTIDPDGQKRDIMDGNSNVNATDHVLLFLRRNVLPIVFSCFSKVTACAVKLGKLQCRDSFPGEQTLPEDHVPIAVST